MKSAYIVFYFLLCTIYLLSTYLAISYATLSCEENQTYIKVRKQNGLSHANEEEYKILLGNSIVVSSPVFANNELRVNEYCLSSSTNQQYSLKLIDT